MGTHYVLWALRDFATVPLNLVVDSLYVVGIVNRISRVLIGHINNRQLQALFIQLWNLLEERTELIFCTHVLSHTTLPGFLTTGNNIIDQAVSTPVQQQSNALQSAAESHSFFHQSAQALKRQFRITRADARSIVVACPDSAKVPPVQQGGVNPRGLQPLQVWQTDTTEFPPFGWLQILHITVNTCSKIIWATATTTTNAKASRTHWIQTIAALGKPDVIKTDDAPAYVSNTVKQFFANWHIKHVTGVPYNSTGQAIIERTHQDLKRLLEALKKEGESTPHELVTKACYVLNWLNPREEDKRSTIILSSIQMILLHIQPLWMCTTPKKIYGLGHKN
ncbi:endogenous retrovirus group K member 19 Pol protein-like protein [Turdus rufiventris]|nr:endogenous retrovirus group K member 19 Pol protein-like protein [Turdus rufiventris]